MNEISARIQVTPELPHPFRPTEKTAIHDPGSREEVSPNHSEEQVSTRNEQDLPAKLKDGRTRDLRTHWTL